MNNYLENDNRLILALITALFSIFGYYFWIGFGELFFKNNLALFSISGQIIFFGTIPYFFNKINKANTINKISFSIINIQLLPLVLLMFLGLQAFISSSSNLQEFLIPNQYIDSYKELEKFVESNYSSIMKFDNFINISITILMIAVIPAIFEELFFRKFLLNELIKKVSPIIAISLTSFIFSIVHFNPIHLLQLFVFGFVLGLIAIRTKSISYSIILHFINNVLSLIVYYFSKDESSSNSLGFSLYLFIINLGLLILSIIIILFSYKKILYLTKNENDYIKNEEGDYEKN